MAVGLLACGALLAALPSAPGGVADAHAIGILDSPLPSLPVPLPSLPVPLPTPTVPVILPTPTPPLPTPCVGGVVLCSNPTAAPSPRPTVPPTSSGPGAAPSDGGGGVGNTAPPGGANGGPGGGTVLVPNAPDTGRRGQPELISSDPIAALLGSGIGNGMSLSLFHVWPWLLAAEALLVLGIIAVRALRRPRRAARRP
jgi:hypothetical protein